MSSNSSSGGLNNSCTTKNLSVIIVDDEPLAHNVLLNYIGKIPFLKLVGQFYDVASAVNFLASNRVDLIMLDIQMPDITGIDWIRSMQNPPAVIFTTAYGDYALDAFEYGVVDYLLKPIRFERFLKAVQKATKQSAVVSEEIITDSNFLFVKHNSEYVKVEYKQICYLESYGNLLKIHQPAHILTITETLTDFLKKLPDSHFIRVHKSFAVNVSFVVKIIGNTLVVRNDEIPIGSSYKNNLLESFQIKK